MSVPCITSSVAKIVSTRRDTFHNGTDAHTNLLLLLLVALAGLDSVLGLLSVGDGLLDGEVPAITLSGSLSLESVLGARDLESECVGAVLVEVGSIGQVQGTGGVLLLVGVLDEVEQTLAGLAGPRSDGVSDLGLLATEVLPQVGGRDSLLAEPEVLLSETESAAWG
jgi:hypothetical protein